MEEFVIPLQHEDLINSDATDKYTVDRVLNVDRLTDDEISAKIEEIATRLKEEDDESQREAEPAITGIYEHQNFDPLFSLVKNASKLAAEPKTALLHLLQDGLTATASSISNFFKNPLFEDSEMYTQALAVRRNALKMYVYLLQWLIETEEHSIAKKNSEKIPVAREKGKKGKKKQEEEADLQGKDASIWELDTEKEKIIVMLLSIIDLDLSRLWNLPQPEESFLNLFSRIAFQVMENPANIKSKTIKRAALILVANASVKYYQSFNLVQSVLDSLYKHEHLVTPFVELFEMLVNDHEFHTAVGDLLREIGKLNPRDLTRDTTGAKNVSTFISELAEKIPRAMIPFISFLLTHLEHDSYTMRNGVIQVIGFMIAVQNEGEDARADATTKTRDSLLEILIERFRDINAYTRSKVLQTWSYLCQNKFIPLKMYLTVTQLTAGRLEDKASQVRKSAIQLLTQICQYNPFSAQLRLSTFEENLQKLAKTIKEGTGKDIEALQEADENNEITEDEARFFKLYTYYNDAVQFIREIHSSVPIICELLGSKNASDVLEAIQFFVTATSFNVEKARDGLRKMLMLVWSKENNIREALLKAYVDLYLTPPPLESKNRRLGYLFVAKNLISLTIGATLGELTSMEELLFHLMKEKHVSYGIVEVLWDIFAQKDKENNAEGRGALIVLSMLANADPNIIGNKLNMLVSIGLGPRAHVDPHLGKWACIALQKLSKRRARDNSSPKKKGEKETTEEANREQENKHHHERFKSNHEVFDKLRELVINPEIPLEQWFPAAEQAINTIYMVSEKPDNLMEGIICHLAEGVSFEAGKKDDDMDVKEESDQDSAFDPLTRVLFVVGHCALRQLVLIEEIHREIQRQNFEHDKTKKSQARKEAQKKQKASQKRKSVGKGKKKKDGEDDEDSEEEDIEKELGHVGNMADAEAEAELLSIQKSLVEPTNLLGQFAAVVVKVATNEHGHYSNDLLRSAALLALCKYMLVSPDFCEKNLKLLFTILTHDMDPRLKANIVIVLGDLAVRFPNLLDPWTNHMYTRLRDKDSRVRKNTMMVLTHLILNDMIKVKGQVSEMAICLEDTEQRIADLARLFFHELSCKGNQLYNILPETISGLSASGVLSMDSFRNIMKYLFSFIEKDRQVESLVEKLCHRFPTTVDIKQWQDISYCLSLLNYTEKSVKKLSESFKFYKEAIASEDVYTSFMAIVAKARKFAKPELKAVVDELENKVNACFDSHKENNTVIDKAKAAKEIAKTAPKGKKQAAKKKVESDEEDSGSHDSDVDLFSVEEDDKADADGENKEKAEGEEADAEAEPKQVSKARGGKKRVVEDEDKMDVEEDEKPSARPTRGRAGSQRSKPAPAKAKAPPKGRGKKKQESEDEVSEEDVAELSDDEDNEEEVQPKARPARGSAKSKKAVVESDNDEDEKSASDDEDEDEKPKKLAPKSKKAEPDDDEDQPKKKAPAKSNAKGKSAKRVVESEDEDDAEAENSEPENKDEDVEMLDLDEDEEEKSSKKKAPTKATAAKGKKSKAQSSDDEMDVDDSKQKSRSGSKSNPKAKATEEDDDDGDDKSDEEEDSKPARRGRTTRSKPAPKPAPKKAAPKRGRGAKRVVDDEDSD